MRLGFSVCALAAAIALSGAANAVVIPGLYTTGVDDQGNKLASSGATDPHWLDGVTFVTAVAATTYFHPAYVSSTTANFIGGDDSGASSYFLNFSLAGLDAATAQLSGRFAVDNGATIYLNGHSIGGYVVPTGDTSPYAFAAFQELHDFTTANLANYFLAGDNTIEFRVTDYGHPSGVMVSQIGGTADAVAAAVPEPISWAMMVGGFGLLGATMRRRKVNVTFA